MSRAKDVLDVLLVSPNHVPIGNSAMTAVMLAFLASRFKKYEREVFAVIIILTIGSHSSWMR